MNPRHHRKAALAKACLTARKSLTSLALIIPSSPSPPFSTTRVGTWDHCSTASFFCQSLRHPDLHRYPSHNLFTPSPYCGTHPPPVIIPTPSPGGEESGTKQAEHDGKLLLSGQLKADCSPPCRPTLLYAFAFESSLRSALRNSITAIVWG